MAFRTKKISQMDPKGSNLASTDLLEISELVSGSYVTKSITGAEIIASVPPTSVEWGDITGTLSSQTDLNTALSGKVPTSRTLTINGTTQDLSADRTFTISTGITIGTTAITSGTVGRVLFEGTGNVVQESANLFWDNTNGRLGIGGTPSTFNLDVVGTARVQGNTTISLNQNGVTLINASNTTSGTASTAELRATTGGGFIGLGKYSASTNSYKFIASSDSYLYSATIGDIAIINDFASGRIKFGAGASSTAQATLFSTGNFAINTTTDAGFKLDVNGTARLRSTVDIGGDTTSINLYRSSGANGRLGTGYASPSINHVFLTCDTSAKALLIDDSNRVIFSASNDSTISSAHVAINSTTRGFLPPRMTTTQKNAIATPAAGLVVYDTTLNKLCVRTASAWETITSL